MSWFGNAMCFNCYHFNLTVRVFFNVNGFFNVNVFFKKLFLLLILIWLVHVLLQTCLSNPTDFTKVIWMIKKLFVNCYLVRYLEL